MEIQVKGVIEKETTSPAGRKIVLKIANHENYGELLRFAEDEEELIITLRSIQQKIDKKV